MAIEPIDVLLVDDDPQLRRLLTAALEPPVFRVTPTASGAEALAAVAEREPDVVVLDVLMPGLDGFETCRRLRQLSAVPVLMLTALNADADAARGLEAGADDYVRKPFSIVELQARLHALVRRARQFSSQPQDERILRLDGGRLRINLIRHEVEVDDHHAHLSPLEHRLLAYLATNAQRTISHAELSTALWGADTQPRPAVLRVLVQNIRRKLGRGRCYLVSEYSAGYRLEAALAEPAAAIPSPREP